MRITQAASLFLLGFLAPFGSPKPASAHPDESAVRLFAAVEEAWLGSDAERLASMVDTTVVRIALKPGTTPASAVTRSAAAFLFQDQLRLVKTSGFHVVRVEVNKKGKGLATAEWTGDWGGRQGSRTVKVALTASSVGNHWVLTEVRANE